MGRLKTPTNILEARGSFKKHPERKRGGEPKKIGNVGRAPKWFDEDQRSVWNEFKDLIHKDTLGKSDRPAFEILVTLMHRYRFGTKEGVLPLSSGEFTRLISLLGKFGMTPSDRASINIPGKPKKNPFDM